MEGFVTSDLALKLSKESYTKGQTDLIDSMRETLELLKPTYGPALTQAVLQMLDIQARLIAGVPLDPAMLTAHLAHVIVTGAPQ
jgi:hypothetical protein